MSRTLSDLANELELKAKQIEAECSGLAVKIANTVVTDLAYHTPVDTSKALSNWIVTLDSPSDLKIEPYYPGLGGSTRNASASETIQAANIALQNKKPGQKIYITNSLPYIKRLNEGHSKQVPAGFVERSILIGRKLISNFKFKG